jgi:hypothetical protein
MSETTDKPISVNRALWFGVAFSFFFVGLIWLTGELWLQPPPFAEERDGAIMPGMWYLWQVEEPSVWTRVSAWGFYALHQVSIWYLIWRAQTGDYKYSSNLHWFNVAALGVNALFITLHLLQTHVWYDGLAQDVPEVTSQASVVLVLVAILIMENQRRGMFFGKKIPLPQDATRAIRKYHGYYFSWAILYTFWYHPMEITGRWTIFSELSVVAHGVTVAILASQEWGRFFGGFLGMFVITQMHGLGLSKGVRWTIGIAYIVAVAIVYDQTEGIMDAYEAGLIPLVEFLLVVIVSLIVFGLTRIFGSVQPKPPAAPS